MTRRRRPSSGWWSLRTAGLAGVASGVVLLASATPAGAHAGDRLAPGSGPWSALVGAPAARAVLVAGSVPLAGILLTPLVAGPADRARRRVGVLRTFAAASGAAAVLLGLWAASGGGAAALVLAVLALVAGAAGTGRGVDAVLGLAVLTSAVVVDPRHGIQLVAGAVHLLSAAMWVGIVVQLALLSEGAGLVARALRLHRPVAIVTSAVVLSGMGEALLHVPDARAVTGSGYGRMMLAKAALVAVAAALGWAAHRRAGGSQNRSPVRWFRREVVSLSGVVALAAGLLLVPLPAVVAAGQVAVGTTVRAGRVISAVVVPDSASSGRELVFVGLGGRDPAGPIAGVRVRAGSSDAGWVRAGDRGPGRYAAEVAGIGPSLQIDIGRQTVSVRLAAAGALPYSYAPAAGVAIADSIIGRLAAQRLGAHPEPAGVAAEPAEFAPQGAALGRYLDQRGVRTVGLVVDPADWRSSAFGAGFRSAYRGAIRQLFRSRVEQGVTPSPATPAPTADALVLAGTTEQTTVLLDQARRRRAQPAGIFLAPWLLTTPVLDSAARGGTDVSIGSNLDPTSGVALAYIGTEAQTAPGFLPTYEGLAAFIAALGPRYAALTGGGPAGFRLYAVTAVQFLPAVIGDHQHAAGGWFTSGGQLVPVTGPLS